MTASEFWTSIFGVGVQDATDYTGREIKKAAYNQRGSKYGWTTEYILPLNQGGTDTLNNLQIVSFEACNLRDGKITYSIDGTHYQVRKNEYGEYNIYEKGDIKTDMWEKEFGNKTKAKDFAGRTILKEYFGKTNPDYGSNVDHILPLAGNGKNTNENKQIVHIKTNAEKKDKTTFVANGQRYQVHKTSKVDPRYFANDYDYSQKKYCIVELDDE
ncbi:MAG: hypothetical protein LBP26_06715 [Clostridiales bacterium]|jgi:hypothetical protein|nr:hypothetical protein [Clostridiales bacterium]